VVLRAAVRAAAQGQRAGGPERLAAGRLDRGRDRVLAGGRRRQVDASKPHASLLGELLTEADDGGGVLDQGSTDAVGDHGKVQGRAVACPQRRGDDPRALQAKREAGWPLMVGGGEERGPRGDAGQRGEPEVAEPFVGFGGQPSHDLGRSQSRRGRRCLLWRGELHGGVQGVRADEQVRDRLRPRQREPGTRRLRGPKRAEPQPGGVEDLLQAVGVLDEVPRWPVCQIVEHRTGRQPQRLHLVAGVLVGRCGAAQQRPARSTTRAGSGCGSATPTVMARTGGLNTQITAPGARRDPSRVLSLAAQFGGIKEVDQHKPAFGPRIREGARRIGVPLRWRSAHSSHPKQIERESGRSRW
jgi:hypothetical protein